MIENPYQSPRLSRKSVDEEPSLRKRARLSFRVAVLVLLIPAVYNYWAFDAHAIASGRLPSDLTTFYRTVNVVAFVVVVTLVWFLGHPFEASKSGLWAMTPASDRAAAGGPA